MIRDAIARGDIEWQRHALERMMEREISRAAVKNVLLAGDVIENYPEDRPFPSSLVMGWDNGEPLHVVVALDAARGCCFVITAYRPDAVHFEHDYKTRRKYDG